MNLHSTRSFLIVGLIAALGLLLAPSAFAADPPTTAPMAAPSAAEAPLDREIVAEELAATPLAVEEFGEVVVTATRLPKLETSIPRSINVVKERRIRERGVTSAIDSLDDQVGIWIEKRTGHTSDPVIRGLSGANILALVDGNTLSTFWGEGGFAGDDMYGKINADNLARIEVIRGPGSVLYGSNALGGVINFITKESPFDYTECGMKVGAYTSILGNTAPEGWRVHQEIYGATKNLRFFGGFSYMDYTGTRDGSGQWQSPTDAQGYYGDLAVNWKISDEAYAKFTIQVTDLDPTYRYYRPTQHNENQRIAIAGWLELPKIGCRTGLADSLKVGLYYQNKEDTRYWHDESTWDVTKWGEAIWNTFSADLVAQKQICNHGLTYGLEFEGTEGESPDDEQFTMHYPDGSKVKASPDTTWMSIGGYVHDEWQVSSCVKVTGSVRFDMLYFKSEVDEYYESPGGLDPAADEFSEWEPAFAGGLQVDYAFAPHTTLYGGWSRGFRQFAPKFGVTEHAYGIVVPNGLLTPITADQFELGLKHRDQHVNAEAVGYYTYYNNFQNAVRGTYQGSDWYDYNENGMRDTGEDVYQNVGDGEAYIFGAELAADVNLAAIYRRGFGDAWSVRGAFTYNYGQDTTNDIPLRHTQPMCFNGAVRWEPQRTRCKPFAEFQAKFVDRFDRIPPSRLAGDVGYFEEPQDASLGKRREWGLPGYSLFDFRAGFTIAERLDVVFGINNLLDKLYRPAHGRMDAPGRNFYLSLAYTW